MKKSDPLYKGITILNLSFLYKIFMSSWSEGAPLLVKAKDNNLVKGQNILANNFFNWYIYNNST